MVRRQAETVLRAAAQFVMIANVLTRGPVRGVEAFKSNDQPKGAPVLIAKQLRDLVPEPRTSQFYQIGTR